MGRIAERFLSPEERPARAFKSPSLEAQVTDWCDAIAYTHADMEDAVTMGVLSLERLREEIPLFAQSYDVLRKRSGSPKRGTEPLFAKEVSGMMMKFALTDLIQNTQKKIDQSGVATINDVRLHAPLAGFGDVFLNAHHLPFKSFLNEVVYHHPEVQMWRSQQKEMMLKVFRELHAHPSWMESFDKEDKRGLDRQLCDHIASMTDRSFLKEFERVRELGESQGARKAMTRKTSRKPS